MPKKQFGIDWETIKAEYITADISYRKLAEKWGVPFRTLADRAKREAWAAGRNRHRNNVVKKTAQKVAAQAAADNADKLLRLREAADSMGEVIAEVFGDAEQFHRHIITTGLGKGKTRVECRVEDKVDTKAIKDLTGAMKDLAYVLRNVYDLPTKAEQAAMDAAAERLLLEREKAGGEGEDKEIRVAFGTPEEKGWSE